MAAGAASSLATSLKTNGGFVGTITVSLSNGKVSLSSNNVNDIFSLETWVAAANGLAETNGEVAAFVFSGDTYVFAQNGAQDVLVQLEGVSNFGSLVTLVSNTKAAVGDLFIV